MDEFNVGGRARRHVVRVIVANKPYRSFVGAAKLNSNSRPDKRAILNIVTNQIKDVELKEFVHDSVDECFDALELGEYAFSGGCTPSLGLSLSAAGLNAPIDDAG